MAFDVKELERILTGRLGDEARAKQLAAAYLDGIQQFAFDRTTGAGAVPTTLIDERVEILLAISKSLNRLIDSREIECLFRVVPALANRLQLQLRATHEDTIRPFIFRWALTGARRSKPGSFGGVVGNAVTFATSEQLEAFATEAKRIGTTFKRDVDTTTEHWVLNVAKGFDYALYGLA